MRTDERKLILFIVEGQSEENALFSIMKARFKPNQVLFHRYKGDLTTKNYKNSSVVKEIENILSLEMKRYGLIRTDIAAVIELIDTDGVFIDNSHVLLDENTKHARYEDNCIFTAFPESIIDRNIKKRKNINTLLGVSELKKGIPFAIFFLSRNIEHALYGIEKSVSDSRKTDLALSFSSRFGSNWKKFLSYLERENVNISDKYRDSWSMIKKGSESLKRHTNIDIALKG